MILDHRFSLRQIVLEFFATRGVAKFTQSLGFNLSNALAGDIENAANFFESLGSFAKKTKAQRENFGFAFV